MKEKSLKGLPQMPSSGSLGEDVAGSKVPSVSLVTWSQAAGEGEEWHVVGQRQVLVFVNIWDASIISQLQAPLGSGG